ncbi:PilW family protein [Acidovorax radicis]|uniref:PilW family protein n=1 Tax=Acidovorax radicis TaxID=758826 RepID=UPI0009DB5AAA|nr:PilW family protein [Acidovorax radicis]
MSTHGKQATFRQINMLHRRYSQQTGATLIELMVGIAIGLLTIAVAIGALMVSRGVSTAVSDTTGLQEQASYAFRIIGQQLRQAGSIRLDLASNKPEGAAIDAEDIVAFETIFDSLNNTVNGLDTPTTLTLGAQAFNEPSFQDATDPQLNRDCLRQKAPLVAGNGNISSSFTLSGADLMCQGSSGPAQPIIKNVSNFQVTYLIQESAFLGTPTIRRANAATAATDWTRVFGVEVCLDLMGDERIDTKGAAALDAQYTNCAGNLASYGNRTHMVFRNTYQLRGQGRI